MATDIWNFGDIKTATRNYAKLKDTTAFSDANLGDAVNRYYHYDFVLDVKPTELLDYWEFNTSSGVDTEALDDTTVAVIKDYGRVADYDLKIYFDEKLYYEQWSPLASPANARPTEALFYGGSLIMSPTPDATYAVKIPCWARPATFSIDSDLPTREEWGKMIAIGTARMLAGQYGDTKRLTFLEALFKEELARLQGKTFEQYSSKRIRPKY